jgi:SAM-dependent methyltransferase
MKDIAYKKMDEFSGKHFWYVGRNNILLDFIDIIMDDSIERILDYGCGAGELMSNLNIAHPSKEIHGADISEQAIDFCNSRGHETVLNLNIEEPKENYYDLVLCLDVIEHISDDVDFLYKMRNLLRSGGQLLITVPAYEILWSGEDFVSNHFRRYTKKNLKNKLIKAGFGIDKISYYNFLLFFPVVVVLLTKRIFRPRSMYESDIEDINRIINRILIWIFSSEKWLLRFMTFPFGASIIGIAKKK